MDGVLVIDKAAGMTSHDVVDRVRKLLAVRRVGHLGTLDPMATGVLPLTIGRATRLARFIPGNPKEYTGEIRLGWATTTGDREGDASGEPRPVDLGIEALLEAMASLTGNLEQLPPEYSAKKIGGVAAHRLARRGREVRLEPAPVEIHAFDLVRFDSPLVSFRVACSAGTYVRSLARDLGERLGVGAHLYSLRRTRSGPFDLPRATPLGTATAANVIPAEDLMPGMPVVEADDGALDRVGHGRAIPCPEEAPWVRIFNKKGRLIAVAAVEKGWAHPKVVLL